MPRAFIAVLAYLLAAMIGVIDYVTGTEVSVSVFYVLPVSVAAWFLSKWEGLGVSLASAIIWFAADVLVSRSYSHPVVPYWNALVMLGFFVSISLVISELKSSLERENRIARNIQSALMPTVMPKVEGVEFAATWLPASNVGGDCYDVIRLSDTQLALCIADATGHGVPAALLISNFQAALRFLSREYPSPGALCDLINKFMFRNFGPANLITLFYAVLDADKKQLVYANAGHTAPILVHADGSCAELSEGGVPLGAAPEFSYGEGAVALRDGDFVAMYTDGVIELRDKKGEMFGAPRLKDVVIRQCGRRAEAVRDSIVKAVNEYGLSYSEDDLTLLVLSVDHVR
ncbi:MAG: PP2C family protein-serine/threonine phosphatase [Acidobacteriota bacterium]